MTYYIEIRKPDSDWEPWGEVYIDQTFARDLIEHVQDERFPINHGLGVGTSVRLSRTERAGRSKILFKWQPGCKLLVEA